MGDYYKKGDWNAICDTCGFKFKASQLRKTWDGFYVCKNDWEPRHPQERLRSKPDNRPLPWTRPDGPIVSAGGVITLSASATPSVSPLDVGGSVFRTNGTTPITNFVFYYTGQTIRVMAADTITIRNNATIKLATGVDFDMRLGDSLTLYMADDVAGVWTEVERYDS